MLPRPSVVYAASNDAISYDPATKTVTIQGNCDTDEIYAFMHGQGEGVSATTLHFAGTSVIRTPQYDPDSGQYSDPSDGPFASTQLVSIEADSDAQVSFTGKDEDASPVLTAFFASCSSLSALNGLSAWNVGNVSGDYCMYSTFYGCTNLTSLDGLSAWDVGNVSGTWCMGEMFRGCTNLTSLDGLSAWDVGNVSGNYCMSYMFYGCTSLTSLDGLSAWDVSNVRGNDCMSYMFYGCTSLTSLDGLSAWDVGNVRDKGCMGSMFNSCSGLTSLDGLSAWDVGNVSGDYCMNAMFYGCTNLVSLDAIASWNINAAINSSSGVNGMFSSCDNIASITLGGANGFKLSNATTNDMSLPSANWWPVDDTSASAQAIDTATLVSQSQTPSTLASLRWQITTAASNNPMISVSSVQVSWPLTANLTYNGLLQTIHPVSVTADGTTLEEGRDFYISYTKDGSELSAIKNAGIYTAHVILRGTYVYSGTDALPFTPVTIEKLNLDQNQNVEVFCLPSVFTYTGSAIEPKTMVRLYLRDDPNPASTQEIPLPDIPIYSYLIQSTGDIDKRGDYSVSYANNINSGTADATVQGVAPAGLSSSNLEGTSTAHFTITGAYIVAFDSNGGSAVEPKEVAAGHPVTKPEDPTREGYSFLYWCTDEALTDKFDFAIPITADITLYAKWEQTPDPTPTDMVTLTFRTDEGSWNGITETTRKGAPDAAIIAPVYPTVDATRTCIGWFDETGKQVVSGVSTFGEVTGVVTARFVDTPGWHQNATGWWYVYDFSNNYYTNCWALINSAWFYFNDAGYCLEYTWGYINGNWYFFGWGGYMQTGWQWLGGSWYFLDRNSGAMKCGWVHDGVWYYCDAALGGAMYDNCWAYINGEWYGFNEGGSMTQGWSYSYSYDGWFYLQPDTGHMLYSWQYIGGHWYYFYDNGLMAANTYVGTYWLGSDGAMW